MKMKKMHLSKISRLILQERYLLKNEEGKIIETPEQLFRRVATQVSKPDRKRLNPTDFEKEITTFYQIMLDLEFIPNSPTLMNAGTTIGQLSACFVLPIKDSIDGIFNAVKNMALIHKSGGGTGFSFSELRPKGDIISSTMGHSSGPISFMHVFDSTTSAITQGGKRRGANMGILDVSHPDIEEFINIKRKGKYLTNFNLSVAVTDDFINAVKNNEEFSLINPRNQKVTRKINAAELFDKIALSAWECGDPGLIFIDEINRNNPTPSLGNIKSTNPCGEIPLYAYESCNLGSINLAKVVKNHEINWEKLEFLTKTGIIFLDNVIDSNYYPLPEIELNTKRNRKIGLGVMGFADMLILLGIRYDDNKAIEIAHEVMKFIQEKAREKSVELGLERGSFPNFKESIYYSNYDAMRNATRTAIAPTGTISLIASCSSGIEPVFSIYMERNIDGIGKVKFLHPLLETQLKEMFNDADKRIQKIKDSDGKNLEALPDELRNLYVTALNVKPEWHVRIQAAFQKHVDNSVSKTINMKEDATVDDVKKVFLLAHELKCKGVTVYRNKSKSHQVIEY
ncbi:MAG: adenosylcobalamin-dependent ribonucleoside-diphosphate reductase [Promethearchaeota archaeon]